LRRIGTVKDSLLIPSSVFYSDGVRKGASRVVDRHIAEAAG
jgi:hypothetical protein